MAFYFGRLLEEPRNEIAIVHSLCDVQTLWYWPKKEMAAGAPLEHPAILGLRVWGANLGDRRMEVKSSALPQLKIDDTEYPAVYLFASENSDSRFLIVINLDPVRSHRIIWQQIGNTPVKQTLLTGPAINTSNFADWGKDQTAVAITTTAVTPDHGNCIINLPPHSMTGLKAKR